MNARIIGGLVYDLGNAPTHAEFGRNAFDGTRQQRLVLGDTEGSDKLSISLTETPVEGIDDLIEALHRIRDDKIRNQIKQLPEVAA
ncbi:hypothetical protein ACIRF8_15065 [Streptomyces sp. NPDC102406]|uniref:hypothetical protein n=1 Tax=Streptomyces sp. NPDC102406 TaxID=3366171 RepID=UPI003813DB6D